MIKTALDAAIGPVVGTIAAVTLDGNAMMPLGAALGAVVTMVGLSIKMTKQWTVMEETIGRLKEELAEIKKSQHDLSLKLENFPCPNHYHMKQGGGFDSKTTNER